MNEENPMLLDNLWRDNAAVLLAGDEEQSGLEPDDRYDE